MKQKKSKKGAKFFAIKNLHFFFLSRRRRRRKRERKEEENICALSRVRTCKRDARASLLLLSRSSFIKTRGGAFFMR